MLSLIKRFVDPLTLRVDFTDPLWKVSPSQARSWLLGAVAADLLVQFVVGQPSLFTVLASSLTILVFWAMPARLSGAVGCLYIAQALCSWGIVSAVSMLGNRGVVETATLMWSGWCLFALLKLLLSYLRTPKASM